VSQVTIVTDSASDLPVPLASAEHITVVPLDVRLGAIGPETLCNASGEEFWALEATSGALAETSAPSPGMFAAAFTAAADSGASGVCCVTISSDLSATYQAALAGASEVASRIEVAVVDSRSATLGEGLVVLEAAERARTGATLEEVAASARDAVARGGVVGTLDTLDNLRRGGRIGAAQALVGSMLSIKPVIEVRNGVIEPESRQRTRARSLQYLADKVRGVGTLDRLGIVHAAATDIEAFLRLIDDVHPAHERIVTYIGPVIGAHTGRGTVGVCYVRSA